MRSAESHHDDLLPLPEDDCIPDGAPIIFSGTPCKNSSEGAEGHGESA